MTNLTARQTQVLELIKHYLEATGYPPTRAEIARELGFRSANAAEEHLKALARKGAIEMVAGTSRGIRLPNHQTGLPVVGRVAAGNPILAQEHIESYCEISANFFHPPATYLLRVNGMSMRNAGIFSGDLIAVKRTQTVHNGQIIVARIGDEVTVKRFRRKGNRTDVQLLAENEEFETIQVNLREQDFAIEGLVVGVIRQGVH